MVNPTWLDANLDRPPRPLVQQRHGTERARDIAPGNASRSHDRVWPVSTISSTINTSRSAMSISRSLVSVMTPDDPGAGAVAGDRHEVDRDRTVQGPNQIGEKDEATLEDRDQVRVPPHGVAPVDFGRQLTDPLAHLVSGEQHRQRTVIRHGTTAATAHGRPMRSAFRRTAHIRTTEGPAFERRGWKRWWALVDSNH